MTTRTYAIGNARNLAQLRRLHYESQVNQYGDKDGVTQDDVFDRRVTDSYDENIVREDTVSLVSRMVTREAHRGQRNGYKVLSAAEDLAIKAGAKSFILDSTPKAEQFYAHLGYNRSDSMDLFEVQDILMIKSVV